MGVLPLYVTLVYLNRDSGESRQSTSFAITLSHVILTELRYKALTSMSCAITLSYVILIQLRHQGLASTSCAITLIHVILCELRHKGLTSTSCAITLCSFSVARLLQYYEATSVYVSNDIRELRQSTSVTTHNVKETAGNRVLSGRQLSSIVT